MAPSQLDNSIRLPAVRFATQDVIGVNLVRLPCSNFKIYSGIVRANPHWPVEREGIRSDVSFPHQFSIDENGHFRCVHLGAKGVCLAGVQDRDR